MDKRREKDSLNFQCSRVRMETRFSAAGGRFEILIKTLRRGTRNS